MARVWRWLCGCWLLAGLALAATPLSAAAAELLDWRPRVAVTAAHDGELSMLMARVQHARHHHVNGVRFTTGSLEGRRVLLFASGRGMVNTAMNMQLALDRFRITHIIVSGRGGSVNAELHVGDVSVPAQWGQYLDVLIARETAAGVYALPPGHQNDLSNFGMLHPRPAQVRSSRQPQPHAQFWFPVDPAMLDAARELTSMALARCDADGQCLPRAPRVLVGGHGVSGTAFVDNAAFREYLFQTFQAYVLDMSSAAVAMVAYSNDVPFIVFRAVSNLAGGGEGENEAAVFGHLAALNAAEVVVRFLQQWQP